MFHAAVLDARTDDRLSRAVTMVTKLIGMMPRKSSPNIPALSHPFAVLALVVEAGGDADQQVAAVLHDVLEDYGTLYSAARMATEFGPDVLALVRAASDCEISPESPHKRPWQERKEAYVASLDTKSAYQLLVVAADKVHNLSTLLAELAQNPSAWNMYKGGRNGTQWYYTQVIQAIAHKRPDCPLVGRLMPMLEQLNRY